MGLKDGRPQDANWMERARLTSKHDPSRERIWRIIEEVGMDSPGRLIEPKDVEARLKAIGAPYSSHGLSAHYLAMQDAGRIKAVGITSGSAASTGNRTKKTGLYKLIRTPSWYVFAPRDRWVLAIDNTAQAIRLREQLADFPAGKETLTVKMGANVMKAENLKLDSDSFNLLAVRTGAHIVASIV